MDLLKFSKRILVSAAVISLLVACEHDSGWVQNVASGPALGTTFNIVYHTRVPKELEREIDSVFNVINESMSTYLTNSDISRINAGDSSVVVDEMFREVFALSTEVYEKTKGYFDPTVKILVDAWGFGPGRQIKLDSAKVDSLLKYVGLNKVSLTEESRIEKEEPGIQLDFNAVAKGYAIDRLGRLMEKKLIENYLIEVGGELLAKGENRIKKKRWVVGIDDPQVEVGRRLIRTIYLKDRAMASSGNYRKFRVDSITGERYVHTINPQTGYTRNSNILSASVLAKNCAMADAYATAFMAMELEKSRAVLEKELGLDAYIIYLDEEGEVDEYMTDGFRELLSF